MVTLNLNTLDLGDARRRAAPVAQKLLMTDVQMDELLNPVRHHASGRGDRRARQLLDAYNHFREGTVDQIVGSAAIPQEHMASFERDIIQRAEQVNRSFGLLACYALAELTDPSPPDAPVMVRSGNRMAPGVNQHFGGETAWGVADFTVNEINSKANHFWNSVLRRVELAEREDGRCDRNGCNDDCTDGNEEYPDLY